MNFKKFGLFGLLFGLSFFLIACDNVPPSDNPEKEVETTATTVPVEGQKINENTYTYYYGQTCSYCKEIEEYLRKSGLDLRINIVPKEVALSKNADNRDEMLAIAAELEVPLNKLGTPFIVITSPSGESIPLVGADEALEHFKTLEEEIKTLTNTIETNQ